MPVIGDLYVTERITLASHVFLASQHFFFIKLHLIFTNFCRQFVYKIYRLIKRFSTLYLEEWTLWRYSREKSK